MRFSIVAASLIAAVAAQYPVSDASCAAPVTVTVTEYVPPSPKTPMLSTPLTTWTGLRHTRLLRPPACRPTTPLPPSPRWSPRHPLSAPLALPLPLELALPRHLTPSSPVLLPTSRSAARLPVSVLSLLSFCRVECTGYMRRGLGRIAVNTPGLLFLFIFLNHT